MQTNDGKAVALAFLIGALGTLLNFMRGTWCPECASQLRGLKRHQHASTATSTRRVVIMADVPAQVATELSDAAALARFG